MATEPTHCPIWGDPYPATIDQQAIRGPYLIVDSPRCGGKYRISNRAQVSVNELDAQQKARLTTLLIDERRRGNPCPQIDNITMDNAKRNAPLSVHDRAERLLEFVVSRTEAIGQQVPIHDSEEGSFAWSESVYWIEVEFLIKYLVRNQWIDFDERLMRFSRTLLDGNTDTVRSGTAVVSVAGYARIADQSTSPDSSQAFVAMWFDPRMDEAYSGGISPGIIDAGYDPLRIDQKPDVNKIDDEIIAEIRRSRFLVVDFTHGDDGARGGVYYEAGFAHGLGLPVIFSCREDIVESLHFDTRQYHHIVWETPAELREGRRNRILALIGAGPGEESTVT